MHEYNLAFCVSTNAACQGWDTIDENEALMEYAYLFEAKGIGRYIMQSGRMRDLIGASDLVAGLANSDGSDLIGKVIKEFGIEGFEFSRRAGGSFCLHSSDLKQLKSLSDLWRLTLQLLCPGLGFTDGFGKGDTFNKALLDSYLNTVGVRENEASSVMPFGHPLTQFAQLTGLPVANYIPYGSKKDEALPVDFVTLSQAQRGDAQQGSRDGIAGKFLPAETEGKAYVFPRNMEQSPNSISNPSFPFLGSDVRVAMVHADISGLGLIFRKASEKLTSADELFVFAERIEGAIKKAVKTAVSEELLPHAIPLVDESKKTEVQVVPARPVLLGGDDVIILVRADLALSFTATLLKRIECETQAALENVDVEYLSACAGILVARSGQPFAFMHALAEDLCTFAKTKAKSLSETPVPSGIAFHLAQTTLVESFDVILEKDLTSRDSKRMTAIPYYVGKSKSGPKLSDLLTLAAGLSVSSTSGINASRSEWFEGRETAKAKWDRWRTVIGPDASKKLDASLEALAVTCPENSPFTLVEEEGDAPSSTPIFDALETLDFGSDKKNSSVSETQT